MGNEEALQQLHQELDDYAANLTDEQQEALLRDIQGYIQQHLEKSPEEQADNEADLSQQIGFSASQFEAEHPSLTQSLMIVINSLSNSGI